MNRKTLFVIITLSVFQKLFAWEPDTQIVRTILDKCGFDNLTVKDVAVLENDSVVRLNISNRDISRDGIFVLPAELGKLTALKELDCRGNSIRDLPPEIGELVNLRVLNAGSNRLIAIPPEIGKLKNLVRLDLRHNDIGVLPPEIGELENLEYLWLWGNKLTSLTPEITRLHRLKELYLTDNRLSTLPVGIIRMRLRYIDFIGNKLCNLSSVLDYWARRIDDRYLITQRCR